MRYIKKLPALAIVLALFNTACNSPESPKQVEKKPAAKVIQQPFKFHKAIEVKPGLTLDVLSWGRGSESGGAYLILRSDSTHMKYRSIQGELDGVIVDAWNMDMDTDGNPELYIQAKGEGEGSYMTMYVYEFNESGSAQELNFPELRSSTKRRYKGGDTIYIKDGKLIREFPLLADEDNKQAKPGLDKMVIEYSLRGNSFNVEQLNKEEDKN